MGKLTISMAIFNSYVSLPEGMIEIHPKGWIGPHFVAIKMASKMGREAFQITVVHATKWLA